MNPQHPAALAGVAHPAPGALAVLGALQLVERFPRHPHPRDRRAVVGLGIESHRGLTMAVQLHLAVGAVVHGGCCRTLHAGDGNPVAIAVLLGEREAVVAAHQPDPALLIPHPTVVGGGGTGRHEAVDGTAAEADLEATGAPGLDQTGLLAVVQPAVHVLGSRSGPCEGSAADETRCEGSRGEEAAVEHEGDEKSRDIFAGGVGVPLALRTRRQGSHHDHQAVHRWPTHGDPERVEVPKQDVGFSDQEPGSWLPSH